MNTSVAYPFADLSSGLSTTGILICGDKLSIDDNVQKALHAQQELLPYYINEVKRLTELIQKLK